MNELEVIFFETFDAEFEAMPETVQDEFYALARMLERFGLSWAGLRLTR